MPTQHQFCRVCRQNHDQGKGHRFGTKHKQRLDALLKKIQKNVQEVRFFLKNAMLLKANSDSSSNKFWCHFCEQEIREESGRVACEQTIRHLASKQHFGAVKKFWFENGGDVSKQQVFFITDSDFGKWEEACTALPSHDGTDSNERKFNNIHSERSVTHATSVQNVSKSSVVCASSSLAVKPLSVLTGQSLPQLGHVIGNVKLAAAVTGQPWAEGQLMDPQFAPREGTNSGSLVGNRHAHSGQVAEPRYLPTAQAPVSNLSETESGHQRLNGVVENRRSDGVTASGRQTEGAVGQNLTAIRTPLLNSGEGNVHSGALPPWLKPSNGQQSGLQAAIAHSPSPSLPLSRTQQRKLAKLRNPNRVGAAWAERRLAEMERERRGEVVEKSVPDSSVWLPSFGRVWQSGSRRETRKEFEAEKRREGKRKSSGRSKDVASGAVEIRPYVSKRLVNFWFKLCWITYYKLISLA
ncbi:hypothetical protein R1sor_002307 [Riccia sorocarpa]|uniref:Coiled-coil domain-containing protein 84 n=1 Tax=Riccia sorocarpa TaxID=122646 RepID=A0ABD3GYF5_9MARC